MDEARHHTYRWYRRRGDKAIWVRATGLTAAMWVEIRVLLNRWWITQGRR